jgi:hypothetical protein
MNNTAEDWTPTTKKLPPPEVLVETIHKGVWRRMERIGRLWFFEDGKRFFSRPEYWRSIPEKPQGS